MFVHWLKKKTTFSTKNKQRKNNLMINLILWMKNNKVKMIKTNLKKLITLILKNF